MVLIDRPNTIVQKQIRYQSMTNTPIYLRQPRSRLYIGAYLTLFSVGMVGTFTGLFSVIKGKGAAGSQ
ncbi:hypothetical protein BKA62DRAFT_392814 [Auriculariales sp. MPI-PUGE-AT-0066]|nr:hypothetical protein BKA62DRAFT_392814 [Auriculariales sp. MPI-PUGE-AT-0066]